MWVSLESSEWSPRLPWSLCALSATAYSEHQQVTMATRTALTHIKSSEQGTTKSKQCATGPYVGRFVIEHTSSLSLALGHPDFGPVFPELGHLLALAAGLQSRKLPQYRPKGDQDPCHTCSRHNVDLDSRSPLNASFPSLLCIGTLSPSSLHWLPIQGLVERHTRSTARPRE